jgi:flagellar biosynthesis protein FlhG
MTWNDQAAKLREMMKDFSPKAKIITLTSGKGGVGKTVTATNLGLCLAATGKRVVLVDADLGLANVDVLLGINRPYNIFHVLSGQVSLNEIIVEHPAGLQIIPGGSGIGKLANMTEFERQHLMEILSDLQNSADVVIFDTSAGINRNVMAFVDLADLVMVVTTPDPAAITDAYAMIKTAVGQQIQGRLCVLMNRVTSRHEARACQQRLSQVTRKFLDTAIFDAGYILEDPHVAEAVRARKPFVLEYPKCQASYCMMSLAAKLGKNVQLPTQKVSFLRKVANLFW